MDSKKSVDPTQSVKLTYNLPGTARLVGYYQNTHKQVNPYNTSSIPLRRLTAGTAFYGTGTAWDQSYPAGVYKGEYSKVMGNNATFEVRAGNWYATWKNYSLAPDQRRYEDIVTLQLQGGAPYYEDLRTRPQLNGSMNYYKRGWMGSHDFKAGGELLRENDDQHDGGTVGNTIMILRSGTPIEAYVTESPNDEQSGLWARSLYFTDMWHPSSHLTLDLGVRYDGYRPFLDAQSHTFGTTTTSFDAAPALLSWNNWAPRFGIVYDITGKAKTVVKANYGLYFWNPASDFAATLNPNQVFWWKRYNWNDSNGDAVFQPNEAGTLLQTNGGVASAEDRSEPQEPVHHPDDYLSRARDRQQLGGQGRACLDGEPQPAHQHQSESAVRGLHRAGVRSRSGSGWQDRYRRRWPGDLGVQPGAPGTWACRRRT